MAATVGVHRSTIQLGHQKMEKTVFLLCLLSLVNCAQFLDRSGNIIETDQNDPRIDWDLLSKSQTQWNGIFAHRCSSALIQTWPDGSQPDPSVPAYLLTAGHCMAPFKESQHRGKVYMDAEQFPKNFSSEYTVDSIESDRTAFPLKTIRFATMNLTDLAIVELGESAQQMIARGYNFYKLSKTEMIADMPIEMVGYPAVDQGFRRYSKGVAIKREEIDEAWGHHLSMTWNVKMNSWGGSSGSPVFDRSSKQIVGVFTQGGGYAKNYVNRAENVHACFDLKGIWNFGSEGCLQGWKKSWKDTYNFTWPGYSDPPKTSDPKDDKRVSSSAFTISLSVVAIVFALII